MTVLSARFPYIGHRSQLLKSPHSDTCCEGRGRGERDRYICDLNQLLFLQSFNKLSGSSELKQQHLLLNFIVMS